MENKPIPSQTSVPMAEIISHETNSPVARHVRYTRYQPNYIKQDINFPINCNRGFCWPCCWLCCVPCYFCC